VPSAGFDVSLDTQSGERDKDAPRFRRGPQQKGVEVRRARVLVLVVSATAVLTAVAPAPATAAPGDWYRSRGVSAFAGWDKCNRTTCFFLDLYVFDGSSTAQEGGMVRETSICLYLYTDARGVESGCASAPEGSLGVPRDLSSATLSNTTVDLHPCRFDPDTWEEVCNPNKSRQVTLGVNWTATSPPVTSSERYTFKDGECSETYVDRGTFRDARARGTLDGVALGRSYYAGIHKGMTRFRSTCEYFEH
jgi:hypothetical protein